MNNLAYVVGTKPVLKFSYYVGTLGEYDLTVIPRSKSAILGSIETSSVGAAAQRARVEDLGNDLARWKSGTREGIIEVTDAAGIDGRPTTRGTHPKHCHNP